MKTHFPSILFILFSIQLSLSAHSPLPFVSYDIFQTRYFIKNNGQFDKFGTRTSPVLFGVENLSDHFYFSQRGFVCSMNILEPKKKNDLEEEEEEENRKAHHVEFNMEWLGANKQVEISTEEKSNHYFTYGAANLNSFGYKKITYKNLYPNIDVVYEIPARGGIKYSVVVKPGGDLSLVRFKYNGANTKTEENRLIVQTPWSTFAETIPLTYEEQGDTLSCRFIHNGVEIGLSVKHHNPTKILVVDPWVSSLTTLLASDSANNKGFDIDFDYAGNLYVYGGGHAESNTSSDNPEIAKYDINGNLLWTFTGIVNSIGWNSGGDGADPSNFVVEKLTGKCYIGQAVAVNGSVIVRIDPNGNYDNFVSNQDYNFKEVWDMLINCQTGSLIGMGGSWDSPLNLGLINTSSGATTYTNFTGNTTDDYQDIVSHAFSEQGELFVVMASLTSNLNNTVFKVNPNLTSYAWIQSTGFNAFDHDENKPMLGPSTGLTANGFNALSANSSYLFYYDGYNVKAFNKTTGISVGTPAFIGNHLEKFQGGIFADECNNVYVGGNNGNLKVFHFSGSAFAVKPDIIIGGPAIGKHVYDIRYNSGNNLLYVSGEEFVASILPSIICSDSTVLNISIRADCSGLGILEVLNPDLSGTYTYIWTDSTTGNVVSTTNNTTAFTDTVTSLVSGKIYSVTAIKNALCGGASAQTNFHISGSSGIGTIDSVFLCANQPYLGHSYASDTALVDTIPNSLGCDSIVKTIITISNDIRTNQQIVVCYGDSLFGQLFLADSVWVDTIQLQVGCDSIHTTNIRVFQPAVIQQNVQICTNQLYLGQHYNNDTIIYDSLTTTNGCDSIRITNLHISTFLVYHDTVTICKNQLFLGHYFFSDTTVVDTLQSSGGCDSINTVDIHVLPSTTTKQTVTLCANQIYSGHYFINDTTISDTLLSISGCDSIVQTLIRVLLPLRTQDSSSICLGQIFHNQYFQNDTVLSDTLIGSNGCDSIHTLNIKVQSISYGQLAVQVCQFQSYRGWYFSVDTILTDTLTTFGGCDSILTTSVSVIETEFIQNTISICQGDTFIGKVFNSDTIIQTIYQNSMGCDSTVEYALHIFLLPPAFAGSDTGIISGSTALLSASGGLSYLWNTEETTSSISVNPAETTLYFVEVTDSNGCLATDSILVSIFGTNLAIPSAFSPNKDGRNDRFGPYITGDGHLVSSRIYNRWGQLIYHGAEPWDGTYESTTQPAGTYVYYMDIEIFDEDQQQFTIKHFNGAVTLLR